MQQQEQVRVGLPRWPHNAKPRATERSEGGSDQPRTRQRERWTMNPQERFEALMNSISSHSTIDRTWFNWAYGEFNELFNLCRNDGFKEGILYERKTPNVMYQERTAARDS